jgi:cellulase/cellobiase CelA1
MRINPFATPTGWYVSPAQRENVLGTLARASDANAAERRALEAMARAPTALWIDTRDKVLGSDSLRTLEGALANASGEARKKGRGAVPELCIFVLYVRRPARVPNARPAHTPTLASHSRPTDRPGTYSDA